MACCIVWAVQCAVVRVGADIRQGKCFCLSHSRLRILLKAVNKKKEAGDFLLVEQNPRSRTEFLPCFEYRGTGLGWGVCSLLEPDLVALTGTSGEQPILGS